MRRFRNTTIAGLALLVGLPALLTTTAPTAHAADVLVVGFESGLDGWVARSDADGPPQVATTSTQAHSGTASAEVSGRTSQGDGIGRDVTGILVPGSTYDISAWVRFAEGEPPAPVWMSLARTSGGATSYDTVGTTTASGWTQITATYQLPAADSAFLYFETAYPDGTAATFYLDDVTVTESTPPPVQDLTPLQDTVDFPLGVAIDSRETAGGPAELLNRHFNQITPENHMKPSYWYADDRTFGIHPEAATLMRFAQDHGLRLYGHTLVWHQQTPGWFFQRDDGTPLTTSPEDRQLLRDRLRSHVFGVAEALSTGGGYGAFGSATNPVVAFDVVNEVIADTEESDGLRRSEWYRVLGEEYVSLAFRYADEAFNQVYAAPGSERPVTLFINDYNTEQSGKRGRYRALIDRLLAAGVPVDGVGHQFHLSLSTPLDTLDEALTEFSGLPVTQAVTELDVPTGTPESERLWIEQGYFYRDVFRILRSHGDELFSASVWGLIDGRSWRAADGGPLLFDDRLQAKYAYYGAADAELPPRRRAAVVFQGSVRPTWKAPVAPVWELLPPVRVGDIAGLGFRWEPDHLTLRGLVRDRDRERGDRVVATLEGSSYTIRRRGRSEVPSAARRVDGGWAFVARLPLSDAGPESVLAFDAAVHDGGSVTTWNDPGAQGELTLVEPLSVTNVTRTRGAPAIDGTVDRAWRRAGTLATGKVLQGGDAAASAAVRTLWSGSTLYVLARVTDPVVDVTSTDPWQRDSVEIFLDVGNDRAGTYGADDTQMRINAAGDVSFGTGDEAAQRARLTAAVRLTARGYVVEAAIDLTREVAAGSVHGFDVQVNDAAAGSRTGIRTWADPTGLGYLSTERWGSRGFGAE